MTPPLAGIRILGKNAVMGYKRIFLMPETGVFRDPDVEREDGNAGRAF